MLAGFVWLNVVCVRMQPKLSKTDGLIGKKPLGLAPAVVQRVFLAVVTNYE